MPRFQSTLEWWKVFQCKAELDLFLPVCAVFHVLPPLFWQSGPSASSPNSRCWSLSTTLGNLPFSSPYFTNLNLLFSQLPLSPSPALPVNNWTSHKFWAAAWLAGRIQEGRLPLAGAAFCRVLRLPDVCPAVGRQNSRLQSAFFFFNGTAESSGWRKAERLLVENINQEPSWAKTKMRSVLSDHILMEGFLAHTIKSSQKWTSDASTSGCCLQLPWWLQHPTH